MRYYLLTVQYNKDAGAENRSVPKGFDTREDAIREFHSQMAKDMANSSLGWAFSMVINSAMGIEKEEKFERPEEIEE